VNVGVACHITAASPGGPRYDSTLSPEERSSIRNAVWLCQTCAKLIDSDEVRFTARVLQEWKWIAEQRARQRVETPSVATPGLLPIRVLVVTAGSFFERFAIKDVETIQGVLLPSDQVHMLKDANLAKISQSLLEGYDVIQFDAHVDADGAMILGHDTVSPSQLASLLDGRGIKCALFMTCNSANVIGALHTTDIPCIIASTSNLYVDFCEEFCRAFYSSLSKGFPLHEAFHHANVLSSQALTPSRDLRREGSLCISLRDYSGLTLRPGA
jgi:hypothetical protein